MSIFGVFGRKTRRGQNIETFHKEISGVLEKNLESENFMAAALHAQIGFHEIRPITEQHSGSQNQ